MLIGTAKLCFDLIGNKFIYVLYMAKHVCSETKTLVAYEKDFSVAKQLHSSNFIDQIVSVVAVVG